MAGRCIMMCAGEFHPMKIEIKPDDFVIAVDGGLKYLLEYRNPGSDIKTADEKEEQGILPDFVIGDFDSLDPGYLPVVEKYRAGGKDMFRQLPVEKDDPDTMAAARIALEKGYTEFLIYGGLGARMDHTMANIETLTWISRQKAVQTAGNDSESLCRPQGWLIDTDTRITVVGPGVFYIPDDFEGTVSVFALDRELRGVTIRGLKYEADSLTITNDFPIGCSNETVRPAGSAGKGRAFIETEEGTALIILIENLINTHHGVMCL